MKPIRRGMNPIKVPFAMRVQDPILRDWVGEVREAIRNLAMRLPQGGSGPFMGGSGGSYQFKVSITKDGETYYATVAPGYVRVKNPMVTEDNPVVDYMPEMGGTPLDETVDGLPPKVAVTNGDTVYCYFGTDTHGIPVATPTIEVSDTGEFSTHYQPDPSGTDGEYWLPIASISIADGVVTIHQHQYGGPIEFVPNLLNYEQVGGGREIIKERNQEEDKLKVRTLKEKASEPQLKINQNTDYIELRGNNYDNSITSARKVSMTVKDGFVTSLGYDDTEVGVDGDVTLQDCDGTTELVTFSLTEGRVMSVSSHGAAVETFPLIVPVQSCCWIDDPPEDDWRA